MHTSLPVLLLIPYQPPLALLPGVVVAHASPASVNSRLPLVVRDAKGRKQYPYGNYSSYYGYRNPQAFSDARLEALPAHLITGKVCLDIGTPFTHRETPSVSRTLFVFLRYYKSL